MTKQSTLPAAARRWLLAAAAIAVLVTVGVLAFRDTGNGRPAGYSTEPSGWDLPHLDGTGHVRLSDFAGEPVVVNFFASWCTACDAELPGFAAASERLRGQVTFIGVNALETGDQLYMPQRHGITWWPLARDIGGSRGNGLHSELTGGLAAMPLTAWYGADGHLLHVDRGALPAAALRDRLADLYGVELGPAG